MSVRFPSIKARILLSILKGPLRYAVVRQNGSHKRMESPDYPPITFSYHDGADVSGVAVKKILVGDVGLTEDEALDVLRTRKKRKKRER